MLSRSDNQTRYQTKIFIFIDDMFGRAVKMDEVIAAITGLINVN